MTHKEYNGWTNYETWAVALWIDNDEGAQDYWRERAEELVRDNRGDRDEAKRTLAGMLQNQHEDANPVPQGTVFADLMSAALSEVDWQEIAGNYVDEVEGDEEAETVENAESEA